MNSKEFITIDGIPVEIDGEKNLLELIRKVGIDLPTFCYHTELSVYGACRMCMVENTRGGIEAACSTPPKSGMEIFTNTNRLRQYRKMILELLLSNHCRDCTICDRNGSCKLQELATRFGVTRVRFENTAAEPALDLSSSCISRDKNKCILCGDCVRMCNEVQNVGAIDFAHRGAKMTVSAVFDKPIAESDCVGCGQCAAVCPTGAIVVKNDSNRLWRELGNPDIHVVAQIAPAVRVAVAREFGCEDAQNIMGKIVAAMRRMGFQDVFDTSAGADITVIEESHELLERLEENRDLPLFTSCCPAWVQYMEKKHPEMMDHVSSCRSPMQMLASVIREHYKGLDKRVVQVAIMPCTAKKFEAAREEFVVDGKSIVEYIITTQELIAMIREAGIVFKEIEPESLDMPFGVASGAGVIFGVTGGVTEAVLRKVSTDKSPSWLSALAFRGVRGMEGVKELTVPYRDRNLKIATVNGLANAEKLIERVKSGIRYDFIEVMACPGGCVSGAGQPFANSRVQKKRAKGLYDADRMSSIKRSEENPQVLALYDGVLKGNSHELLHVKYKAGSKK